MTGLTDSDDVTDILDTVEPALVAVPVEVICAGVDTVVIVCVGVDGVLIMLVDVVSAPCTVVLLYVGTTVLVCTETNGVLAVVGLLVPLIVIPPTVVVGWEA